MVACAEVRTFNKRSTVNPPNKPRPNLKHISEKTDSVNPSTSMEIRPCFSSVWRRRLKFSTLPSAVNLDGNKDGDIFFVAFSRFVSTWFSSINLHVAQLSWELMCTEPHSQVLSCYIKDGQDTLRDPRNRPDPERPAHSRRPSMERPCSWPSPEINASNLAQRIAWDREVAILPAATAPLNC